MLAYAGAGLAVARGGTPGKVLAAAGAAAYLSLPVSRALRRRQPLVLPLLPAALLLKDVAKVVGTSEALLAGLRRKPPAATPAVPPAATIEATAPRESASGQTLRSAPLGDERKPQPRPRPTAAPMHVTRAPEPVSPNARNSSG
jgi:hypothetical protein